MIATIAPATSAALVAAAHSLEEDRIARRERRGRRLRACAGTAIGIVGMAGKERRGFGEGRGHE